MTLENLQLQPNRKSRSIGKTFVKWLSVSVLIICQLPISLRLFFFSNVDTVSALFHTSFLAPSARIDM